MHAMRVIVSSSTGRREMRQEIQVNSRAYIIEGSDERGWWTYWKPVNKKTGKPWQAGRDTIRHPTKAKAMFTWCKMKTGAGA
jgi:hypothetical protein